MEAGLAQMSTVEFERWQAYYELEPFGAWREDWRAALIASTMFNMWRGKNTAAAKIGDFMPKFTHEQQDVNQQLQIVEMLNAAFGGKDERVPK